MYVLYSIAFTPLSCLLALALTLPWLTLQQHKPFFGVVTAIIAISIQLFKM